MSDNGVEVELPHVVKQFWHVTIWVEVNPAEMSCTKATFCLLEKKCSRRRDKFFLEDKKSFLS